MIGFHECVWKWHALCVLVGCSFSSFPGSLVVNFFIKERIFILRSLRMGQGIEMI